ADQGKEIGSPLTIINNFVGFKVLIELGKPQGHKGYLFIDHRNHMRKLPLSKIAKSGASLTYKSTLIIKILVIVKHIHLCVYLGYSWHKS
uniref:Uncharacterized protein n=1 Tax=Romanomermis culicivorax TaxID=13658 RepID=A0A915IHD8_ROMCU